jgi:hypothetical protein
MIDIVNTLPKHKSKRYAKRVLSKIDIIILHHSATAKGTPKAFANYHVNTNGWPGIGYHVVISEGVIYKTNSFDTVSYNCAGQNTRSIGICFAADFDKRQPSKADYCLFVDATNQVYKELGRKIPIGLHRDFSTKTCPGKLFDKEVFFKILNENTVE